MTSISYLLNEPMPKAPQSSPVMATTSQQPSASSSPKSLDINGFSDTAIPDRVIWLQLELTFLKQQVDNLERNITLLLSPNEPRNRNCQSTEKEVDHGYKWNPINSELAEYELDDFMEDFTNDDYHGGL